MQTEKNHLNQLVAALPNQAEEVFDLDKIEAFPKLLSSVFKLQNAIYPATLLQKLSVEHAFEFGFLVNQIGDALEVFQLWLKENERNLSAENLNEFTHELVKEQTKTIAGIITKSKIAARQTEDVRSQNSELEKEVLQLSQQEAAYRELVENREQLQQKKQELQQLKIDVKNGRLEALDKEVKEMEKEYGAVALKKGELEAKRNELLAAKKVQEEETQLCLQQTNLLGKTSDLFAEMQQKCQKHNAAIVKEQLGEVEGLKIRLNFNQTSSKGIMDASMEDVLTKAKEDVEGVEQKLRNRMKMN